MERTLAGLLSTMYETDKHPEEQLEKARAILNAIEELGMLPPVKKRCPVLLTDNFSWEPEGN
jgi:hypothetical protein